jgi:hypothetical protein
LPEEYPTRVATKSLAFAVIDILSNVLFIYGITTV